MEMPAPLSPEKWQQHPFVRFFPVEQLALLSHCAMLVQFESGQAIFHEGEPANRFYLILDGAVALQANRRQKGTIQVEILHGGDVLGWSWMFPPYLWHFDAVAVECTQAVFFYGTWLRQAADMHPEFGYELMKRVAEVVIQRLQSTRRQLSPNSKPV
jgi:CRP-like cAMP-binding protein